MKGDYRQVSYHIRWIIWACAIGDLIVGLMALPVVNGVLSLLFFALAVPTFIWAVWASNYPDTLGCSAGEVRRNPDAAARAQKEFREGLHKVKLDLLLSQVRLCASEVLPPTPESLETLEELKSGLTDFLKNTEDPEQRRAFLVQECLQLVELRVDNPEDNAYGLAIQALMDEKTAQLNRLNSGEPIEASAPDEPPCDFWKAEERRLTEARARHPQDDEYGLELQELLDAARSRRKGLGQSPAGPRGGLKKTLLALGAAGSLLLALAAFALHLPDLGIPAALLGAALLAGLLISVPGSSPENA